MHFATISKMGTVQQESNCEFLEWATDMLRQYAICSYVHTLSFAKSHFLLF